MSAVTMAIDTASGVRVIRGRRLDDAGYGWTPSDWQNTPPDAGMVRVLWDGDRQPLWEYPCALSDALEPADQPPKAQQ